LIWRPNQSAPAVFRQPEGDGRDERVSEKDRDRVSGVGCEFYEMEWNKSRAL